MTNSRYTKSYEDKNDPRYGTTKRAKAGNGLGVIILGIFTLGIVTMAQHISDGLKGRS
jgi:hypothetical protein